MTLRTVAAALAAAALLLSGPAAAKKEAKTDEAAAWRLPDDSPAPSDRELRKRFPEMPGVLVLDAVEHRWTEEASQVSTWQRRLRWMDPVQDVDGLGIELTLPEAAGPWTPLEGRARLFGADGTLKAERPTTTTRVDGGLRVEASLPAPAAGDLVDLVQSASCERPSYPPRLLQEALPVLESRVLVVPPPLVTLRAYGSGLPEGSLEPEVLSLDGELGAGWRFRDLPALRTDVFAPPPALASARLLLAIEKYPDLESGETAELDWPTWGRLGAAAGRAWVDAPTLKRLRAEFGESPEPEAVLEVLRERFEVRRRAAWPEHASAAAALEAGGGNSAELALLVASTLGWPQAEGLELVAARPFESGAVAAVAPVSGNFTELLVRWGELWLDTAPGGGSGTCPARLRGTRAASLRAGTTGPQPLPERRAEDNRVERRAKLALTAEGSLGGTASVELSEIARQLGTSEGPAEAKVAREDWGRREGSSLRYGVLPWRLLQELDLDGSPTAGRLDLGWPRLIVDEVAVDLPPGVTGAKLCAPATIDAGPAGRYERSVKPEGRTVTVTRSFRLDLTSFAAEEAAAVFEWLRRIQDAERAETVLQFE